MESQTQHYNQNQDQDPPSPMNSYNNNHLQYQKKQSPLPPQSPQPQLQHPPAPLSSQQGLSEKPAPQLKPQTEFILDWTVKVLGVASAVLFGIWAPISYKATSEGNSGNDAAQSSLADKIDALSTQAMSAMSVQSQSATDLDGLKRKVDGLALLRVYEFCEGREISACESLTSSLRINALITSLVETADRTTAASVPPSRGTTASAPQSGSKSGVGGVRNPLAVALGIVFGALAVIGIVVGVLVWKRRVKRLKTEMVVRG